MQLNSLKFYPKALILITISLFILQSCSSVTTKTEKLDINDVIYSKKQQHERRIAESGKNTFVRDMLFGKDSNTNNGTVSGLSVNPYLWKASLDVIDFMPLSSVNYSGGIIISDWYSSNDNPNESIKITIRFLTNEIRSDALDINVFNRKCADMNLLNCKVVQTDGVISAELKKEILRKATIYKKEKKGKTEKDKN